MFLSFVIVLCDLYLIEVGCERSKWSKKYIINIFAGNLLQLELDNNTFVVAYISHKVNKMEMKIAFNVGRHGVDDDLGNNNKLYAACASTTNKKQFSTLFLRYAPLHWVNQCNTGNNK